MTDKWQKVEAGPTWNFKEEKELVGTYVLKEESVGPNESNLYSIEREDGSVIGVWGNTVLDNKFKHLNIGDTVRLVYLGQEESEKTNRTYNAFDVYTASDS